MKQVTVLISLGISSFVFGGQAYSSKQDYVSDWQSTAVSQMITHKIPASITLAQGIIESSYGNSNLAQKANNHFGIKCHEWKGDRVYQDDDAKNECFRKYTTAAQSYEDHSTFLTSRSRYAKLFDLNITDYKGWAYGLKAAGYATNPKYPELLIGVIEDLKLYEYDLMGEINPSKVDVSAVTNTNEAKNDKTAPTTSVSHSTQKDNSTTSTHTPKNEKGKPAAKTNEIIIEVENKTNFKGVMSPLKRSNRLILSQPNKVKYIVAKKGDTFYKIAEEFELTLSQLHRYNDFAKGKDFLQAGDVVYLQPKRSAAKDQKEITLAKNMSVKEISQTYGVKTKDIVKKNKLTSNEVVLTKGKKVKL